MLFPKNGVPRADTKAWIEQVGRRPVRLPDLDIPVNQSEKSHVSTYSMVPHKENANVATSTAFEVGEADFATSQRSAP